VASLALLLDDNSRLNQGKRSGGSGGLGNCLLGEQ
jgi:hypothetical protein